MFGTPEPTAYHNETHAICNNVCRTCDGKEAYDEAVAQSGPWF